MQPFSHLSDRFQWHVARALNDPLIVLLEEDGIVVREDAFDLGAPSDLAIEACPPTKGKN